MDINAYVDGLKKSFGPEVTGFSPTRDELMLLARHYVQLELDLAHWIRFGPAWGSPEMYEKEFAQVRIGEIRRIVGEDAIVAVVEEVHKKFREQDERLWHVWREGTDEERLALDENNTRRYAEDSTFPDWKWIDEEITLHRAGQCRMPDLKAQMGSMGLSKPD